MKNPFPLISAILCVIYPATLVVELLGVGPSSVITFPMFIGCFVASSLLALVVHDYSRKAPSYDTRSFKRREPQPTHRTPSAAPRGAAWLYRTAS